MCNMLGEFSEHVTCDNTYGKNIIQSSGNVIYCHAMWRNRCENQLVHDTDVTRVFYTSVYIYVEVFIYSSAKEIYLIRHNIIS